MATMCIHNAHNAIQIQRCSLGGVSGVQAHHDNTSKQSEASKQTGGWLFAALTSTMYVLNVSSMI